ncbi:MAG TPA: phosphoribosylformylglycinamidine synthase subunit PurL [Fimbriimonadaceae bacterium]|nr:phosphoribosylformylglycinamidine synthase subunit PurL [Fimbriimonadaceae bacterium]HRJ33798.1 phosphoribosylformylglycinamidine synthase subunit PurL [Fimbriimonadaceae bacterium]
MSATAADVYLSMGLSHDEYGLICDRLGRTPTPTELGMYAVMWSEHCGYKYSRPILAYFKRYKESLEKNSLENAGLVDIGDGLAVTMKVESHNHPSAVEPYQGAATGVGGILRDIFTMGARPIACLNSLRFGPIREGEASPETVARNRYLFEHVVAGIGGYGNCVGVPTVGGEVVFHPRYSGNPLVNAMAVGMMKIDEVTTAAAAGIGNPVLYLGSSTGKDGIHGATFASENLTEESEARRPNVQIGDPFAEKLLIEATLEALQTGAILAIQDMGAAGLTCSTIEMSAKGGVGMEIDLDLVPMRESDMTAEELMLSESQERMLCVAHPGREQEVLDIFHRWGLPAVVIGRVTSGDRVVARRHGVIEADVPAAHLANECPTYVNSPQEPERFQKDRSWSPDAWPDVSNGSEALMTLLASPTLASKRWVYQQFDQEVQTQTRVRPGAGDAAVLAPRGTQKGLALALDGNSRWVAADPLVGGQLVVCEAARNVACSGAKPVAVTDGLNFGSPQQPEIYWEFDQAVLGIARACEALQTPVISGNVSFYNESELGPIPPTPMIGMLGVLEDATRSLGLALGPVPTRLVLVGYKNSVRQQGLGASAYGSEVRQEEVGCPEAPQLEAELRLTHWLAEQAYLSRFTCAHDVSDGGLAFTLAEMAMPHQVGIEVDLSTTSLLSPDLSRRDAQLFGEFPGWVVVGLAADTNWDLLQESARSAGLHLIELGEARPNSNEFKIRSEGQEVIRLNLDEMCRQYEGSIPRCFV